MTAVTKICVVLPSHPSAGYGGAEYQVTLLIERMLEIARDVEVLYLARLVGPLSQDIGYSVRQLKSALGIRRLGFFADSVSLYRALRAFAPDVIYQRVGCAYTGLTALYAKHHAKRMIWHISIDGDLSNHTDRFPPIARRIERGLRDFGIRHATHIVAQTAYQARLLLERYGREAIVLPNFHPWPHTDAAKTSEPSIVWIANMKPAKRPELFIEVASHLRDIPGIRFIMAGKNGEMHPYAGLLRAARTALPIRYVGALDQDSANELIGSAWLLVNTSSDEGFPNTFIQAWQRRTVVASLSIDPDGLLEEFGITGADGSVEAFAERIRACIYSPTQISRLTEAAERHAKHAHSMRNAEQLVALLLNDPAARPTIPADDEPGRARMLFAQHGVSHDGAKSSRPSNMLSSTLLDTPSHGSKASTRVISL